MVWLSGAVLLLSSALLFWLELMVAKLLLPHLGGSAAVWNTCMMFFQVTLVVGYAYAHLATIHLGTRRSAILHLGLLLAAWATLPLATDVSAQGNSSPTFWLLSRLAVMIGLPFFVLSSHSTLIQVWFARSGHQRSSDPYFLYAAGNAGSLLGLLAFPFLIEPQFSLGQQTNLWADLFGVLVLLIITCQFWLLRNTDEVALPIASPVKQSLAQGQHRLQWLLLAAVPSSLLLGVTNYISANVASMPLLWVIPLTLYLITFVIAFSRSGDGNTMAERLIALKLFSQGWASWVVPVVAIVVLPALLMFAVNSIVVLMCLHLLVFFFIALHFHTQLAINRPAVTQLGKFYFWLGLGGAFGGIFNALIAPMIFTRVHEYPFILAVAVMLRPSIFTQPVRRADFIVPMLLGAIMIAIPILAFQSGYSSPSFDLRLAFVLPVLFVTRSYSRPLRFGLSVLVLLWALAFYPGATGWPVHVERSFYNLHRVLLDTKTDLRWLENGNTLHGAQRGPDGGEPLGYYHRTGPLGDVFAHNGYRRVAVVGLGVGSMLAYAKPYEEWTFYELDPVVIDIAKNSGFFTFFANSKVVPRIVLGDGRLGIAAESSQSFDLIVIDAFGSDSVPTHLLTDEAFGLYLSRSGASPHLLFHISNRYLNLAPLVAGLARKHGLMVYQRVDHATDNIVGKLSSHWVMVSDSVAPGPLWTVVPMGKEPDIVWTDSYSSIINLLSTTRKPGY